MKRQFIRIGILLSVAFNVAAIAGVLYDAYFAKTSASSSADLSPAFKQLNMTVWGRHSCPAFLPATWLSAGALLYLPNKGFQVGI